MLELQNISYLVDDDNKEILRDINLAFDEKFVAITGPNGSGKSTLMSNRQEKQLLLITMREELLWMLLQSM